MSGILDLLRVAGAIANSPIGQNLGAHVFGNTQAAQELQHQLQGSLDQQGIKTQLPEIPHYSAGGSRAEAYTLANLYNAAIAERDRQRKLADYNNNSLDGHTPFQDPDSAKDIYDKTQAGPVTTINNTTAQGMVDKPTIDALRAAYNKDPKGFVGTTAPGVSVFQGIPQPQPVPSQQQATGNDMTLQDDPNAPQQQPSGQQFPSTAIQQPQQQGGISQLGQPQPQQPTTSYNLFDPQTGVRTLQQLKDFQTGLDLGRTQDQTQQTINNQTTTANANAADRLGATARADQEQPLVIAGKQLTLTADHVKLLKDIQTLTNPSAPIQQKQAALDEWAKKNHINKTLYQAMSLNLHGGNGLGEAYLKMITASEKANAQYGTKGKIPGAKKGETPEQTVQRYREYVANQQKKFSKNPTPEAKAVIQGAQNQLHQAEAAATKNTNTNKTTTGFMY